MVAKVKQAVQRYSIVIFHHVYGEHIVLAVVVVSKETLAAFVVDTIHGLFR